MKKIIYAFLALSFLAACRKNHLSDEKNLVVQAQRFFDDSVSKTVIAGVAKNPRFSANRSIDWSTATLIETSSGQAVIAPVRYPHTLFMGSSVDQHAGKVYDLSSITKVLFYHNTSGGFVCEQLTSLPDSSQSGADAPSFHGILKVETWGGQAIRTFSFTGGAACEIKWNATDSSRSAKAKTFTQVDRAVTQDYFLTITCELDGYNYSPDEPDDGYSWTEDLGTTVEYLPDAPDGGGFSAGDYAAAANGGAGATGAGATAALTVVMAAGPAPIASISDYLECFTNVGGSDHHYSVRVCVEQPVPGTRTPWTFAPSPSSSANNSNPVNAGHSFLVFSETSPTGTIVRNVGFYPSGLVFPGNPSSPGQLNNNESTPYTISLTISVDNAQFFNMLQWVADKTGANYNLNSFNCTTFVLYTLSVGDISLPLTQGDWAGGSGYDPGDLGQDIRYLSPPSNMTRDTDDQPHPNVGTCD